MLPKVIDNYKATLVGNYTPTDTALTVSVAPTVITEGYLTVFDFDGNQLEKIKFTNVTGSVLTCIRGLSFTTFSDTPVVGNAKDLQNGMYVKLSMSLSYLNSIIDQLQGTTALDGIPKLDPSRIISDSNHLVDKAYADAIGVAGITGFLVQNGTGKAVNINAGTYTKNGEVLTYAGASGVAVATGNNYVEFKDGAISINQTGFTNDAYSLALVVCSAVAITSNTDKRSFINITDLRADTNGTLLTGAVIAGMRVHTGWTGITDGSFRATIDGTAYNFDAINFSTATSMTNVATLIQTKIRAITGATETVSYNATDYKFTITSSTTGTESQISVLSTSAGTVGTDISGANYLNGASGTGTATQGTGNFIARESLGLFGRIGQGLKIVGGYLLPKLKTSGGILSGADGLYVSPESFTGTLYENAVANDPLKLVNDGGVLKLAKIKGYSPVTTQIASLGAYLQNIGYCWKITETKFIILYEWRQGGSGYFYTKMNCVDVSSGTPVMGTTVEITNSANTILGSTILPVKVIRVDDSRFIFAYNNNSNNGYAILCGLSGTTISYQTSYTQFGFTSGIYKVKDIDLIDTDKIIATIYNGTSTVMKAVTMSGGIFVDVTASPVTFVSGEQTVYTRKISTNRYIAWYGTAYGVYTVSGTTISSAGTGTLSYSITDMRRISDGKLGFIVGGSYYVGIITEASAILAYSGYRAIAPSGTISNLSQGMNTNEFMITSSASGYAQLVFDINNDKVFIGRYINGTGYSGAYGIDMRTGVFSWNTSTNTLSFTIGATFDYGWYVGFLEATKTAGQTATVIGAGKKLTGLTNLVQGRYYIGDTGVLTANDTQTASSIEIGKTVSATEILLTY